jgi:hypothetical protein
MSQAYDTEADEDEHEDVYEHCGPDQWERDRASALLMRANDAQQDIKSILYSISDLLDASPARLKFDLYEKAPLTEAHIQWLCDYNLKNGLSLDERAIEQAKESAGE